MNGSRTSCRGRVLDASASLFAWVCGIGTLLLIGFIIWEVIRSGCPAVSWTFLVDEPSDAGRGGGIGPLMISTLLIVATCIVACVPLGLAAAIYLAEYASNESRWTQLIRRSNEVLAGVPSIIFGLFGNAFFCQTIGLGYSILSGGLTLACMVLPLFVRMSEEAIRNVPQELRMASAALGISRTTTIFRVVLPVALPSILAAFALSVGRAMSETAALIFTSGYVTRHPESLLDSGRSISVHIYDLAMNVPGGNQAAYASAAVLIIILVAINAVVSFVTIRSQGKRPAGIRLSA